MKNFITDTAIACAIIAATLAPAVAQSQADSFEAVQVAAAADDSYQG